MLVFALLVDSQMLDLCSIDINISHEACISLRCCMIEVEVPNNEQDGNYIDEENSKYNFQKSENYQSRLCLSRPLKSSTDYCYNYKLMIEEIGLKMTTCEC